MGRMKERRNLRASDLQGYCVITVPDQRTTNTLIPRLNVCPVENMAAFVVQQKLETQSFHSSFRLTLVNGGGYSGKDFDVFSLDSEVRSSQSETQTQTSKPNTAATSIKRIVYSSSVLFLFSLKVG